MLLDQSSNFLYRLFNCLKRVFFLKKKTKTKRYASGQKRPPGPKRGDAARVVPPPPEEKKSAPAVVAIDAFKSEESKVVQSQKAFKSEEKSETILSAPQKTANAAKGIFDDVLFIEDVVKLIETFGEKEPNGPRFRVLLGTLRQHNPKPDGGDLEKLVLAMKSSGMIVMRNEALTDKTILTFCPQK